MDLLWMSAGSFWPRVDTMSSERGRKPVSAPMRKVFLSGGDAAAIAGWPKLGRGIRRGFGGKRTVSQCAMRNVGTTKRSKRSNDTVSVGMNEAATRTTRTTNTS